MEIEVERLDPDWTCFARCPHEGCPSRTFACCEEHALEGISEHYNEEHI